MRLPLASLALIALAACRESAPPRPNVLLITVDTLRADRLAPDTTPRLSAFARECAVFPLAATPRAKTTPAIASLLSGRYPHDHGVRDLAAPLARDVPLLQERLREHGYRTGAIVGNWVLADARSGLARGFDLWCESLPQQGGVPPDLVPERTATSLTDAALVALGLASPPDAEFEPRTLLENGDQPWFLWLHYMDPHGAYQPPERFVTPTSADIVSLKPPSARQRVARHNVPAEAWLEADAFDAALVRARYDGEVRYLDAELGRLLDALRSGGLDDSTVVVLTADHGESLGEQEYYFEHGANAAESTIHVPFLARAPAWAPGERRTPLSLADVTPTVLDLLALPALPSAPSSVHGESVLDALRGAPARSRPLFCEKVERTDLDGVLQQKAVRIGDWKLVRSLAPRRSPAGGRELVLLKEELFDLAGPGGEDWDLSAVKPAGAPLAELRRALDAFVAADPELAELGTRIQQVRARLEADDPEAARALRALGY
jgi:arylsulfatase A-like enzyme